MARHGRTSITAETTTIDPYDILSLTETSGHLRPESDKVAALAESMTRDGWSGAPVLTWAGAALTGTHRIAAARQAGVDILALDLSDLIEDADNKVEAVMVQTGCWDGITAAAALVEIAVGPQLSEYLGNDLDYDLREVDVDALSVATK